MLILGLFYVVNTFYQTENNYICS